MLCLEPDECVLVQWEQRAQALCDERDALALRLQIMAQVMQAQHQVLCMLQMHDWCVID